MKTVFVSGSRNIKKLNELVRNRINNMMSNGFRVVVGDANGADKATQKILAEAHYSNVVVFCSGASCRNNLGDWRMKNVFVDSKFRGREFYTQKDKEMAAEADYGFVIWDGKSAGSINNVLELVGREKSVVVYFSPEKKFYKVSRLDDAKRLLGRCDEDAIAKIGKKINLSSSIKKLELSQQRTFSL